MGDAIACLKVMAPFFQLVDIQDHMHQLLASYAALSATKCDDKLQVVTGTRIKKVLGKDLATMKDLLRNSNINCPEQICSSLQAFQEKWHHLERCRAAKAKAAKGKDEATQWVGNSYAEELMDTIT